MSRAVLPRWPGLWHVAPRSPLSSYVIVTAIDYSRARVGQLVAGDVLLFHGVKWRSNPHPGEGRDDVVDLYVGWFAAVANGKYVTVPGDTPWPPQGWDGWELLELERDFYGRFYGGRLEWVPRLPGTLEPFVDRVLELLGQGALVQSGRPQGMTYTVPKP